MDASHRGESVKNRHTIIVSSPIVRDRKMFLTLFCEEWNKDLCFYYPLYNVDNKNLMVHILWKLSGDNNYVIKTTAEFDLKEKDYTKLIIKKWNFYE